MMSEQDSKNSSRSRQINLPDFVVTEMEDRAT
jgi:hypothetical protein